MKFVALLSGGKDSCFNLIHCIHNGHSLVAAASLKSSLEESDSYMYQTVGQDAIHLVAQALDIPLYRKLIQGSAISTGLEYGNRSSSNSSSSVGVKGDETEDLYELLRDVKSRHPDITAVSVGAILSNYQRVRVEHVCSRLGLKTLSYLWQRKQDELLQEMIDWGLNAIIIKVAGVGLTVRHLGMSLHDMRDKLFQLNTLFGSHICGEGGEYETLTLDCPLFKKSVTLVEVENVIHSDHDFATVAYIRVKNASLVDKPPRTSNDDHPSIPPLLSDPFQSVSDAIISGPVERSSITHTESLRESLEDFLELSSRQLGRWFAVGNVQTRYPSRGSFQEEVQEVFEILRRNLERFGLTFSNILHINIILTSMEHFDPMNEVYKSFFGISPPARACIASDLPPSIRIQMDCVAYAEPNTFDRQALHVQSLSYWAPANIGPYSQAVTADGCTFISGQIGMQPHDLALPTPQALEIEAALSFQHIHSITGVLNPKESSTLIPHVLLCWVIDVSICDRLKGIWERMDWLHSAPVLLVGAKELPKDAVIENQVIMHNNHSMMQQDNDDFNAFALPTRDRGQIESGLQCIHWDVFNVGLHGAFSTVLKFRGDDFSELHFQLRSTSTLCGSLNHVLSARLFSTPGRLDIAILTLRKMFRDNSTPAVSSVRVPFILSSDGASWDFAFCLFGRVESNSEEI